MRALRGYSFIFLCSLAAGCGDGGENGGGGGDGGNGGGETFTVTWGPFAVPAGQESTRCVTRRVGNPDPIRVGQIHNVLNATSHHFIVYRVDDEVERIEPYACQPFADTLDPAKGAPLIVTQKSEEIFDLPDGVAFTLAANQMVRLELHYINATDTEQMAEATATFHTVAEADVEHEADFLFIGNPDVDIPPMSTATLGPTYFPLPEDLQGSSFFAITGHTHQWGTDVEVATTTGPGGADVPVYDLVNFNWDEPETVMHDPPFQVPGGGGFRFTCQWNNLSNQQVGFGESANDEMCFFWAYYYPSKGARVCVHTDQFGGADICCPGNAVCGFLF
jgi:hypothetical protein